MPLQKNSFITIFPQAGCRPGNVSTLPHLTVQTEEDEHHEEETGPEWGQRHHGNSFGVCNECKAGTCIVEAPNTREAQIYLGLTDPDGWTYISDDRSFHLQCDSDQLCSIVHEHYTSIITEKNMLNPSGTCTKLFILR